MPTVSQAGHAPGASFVEAVHSQEPVDGLTHKFYRYPARFSPLFARAAIESFSQPGDVVLDPFMGGATTLVEALSLGRRAIGCDINSLAQFIAKLKTTTLSERDLSAIIRWGDTLPRSLNLRHKSSAGKHWIEAGYQAHLPWRHRKFIEQGLTLVGSLENARQKRFARGILLKLGQLALDCREHVPSVQHFRDEFGEHVAQFVSGMREFRSTVFKHRLPDGRKPTAICLQRRAAELSSIKAISEPAKLVVTSPPYPGVYVLYHRWKVRGRKESPAPYWLADCLDGHGQSHYCFGDRRKPGLAEYFNGIRDSFNGVRQVIADDALVVQMISFKQPEWQIPAYLEAMQLAGFAEVMPKELGIPVEDRLWRPVPGRRWFALIQGDLCTSQELVLFHRPTQAVAAKT